MTSMRDSTSGRPSRRTAKPVTFRLEAPEATSVTIAGDFNDWNPEARPLRRRKDGVWWVTLRLSPCVYHYRFVVNGTDWLEDPANSRRAPNPHGTHNSVCEVL